MKKRISAVSQNTGLLRVSYHEMSLNLPLWSLKSLVFKLFTVTHWWLSVVCSKFALCGFWFTRKMSDNKLLGSFYVNCLTFQKKIKRIKTICKRGKEKPKCCFKKCRRETATRWRFCGTAATCIHPLRSLWFCWCGVSSPRLFNLRRLCCFIF